MVVGGGWQVRVKRGEEDFLVGRKFQLGLGRIEEFGDERGELVNK